MNKYLEICRPDWTKEKISKGIDLSKNVHHDKILNEKIKEIIYRSNFILNYANDFKVYEAISKYYDVNLENLAIGFGATDMIDRTLRAIQIKKLFIVKPSFMMVDVYCKMNNLDYEFIDFKEINSKFNLKDSGIYIVNPNGVNGEAYEIKKYSRGFKYLIVDEVYSDFYSKYSLLNEELKNLIVIKSLSKSLGFAGLRVGFCYSSKEIIKQIQTLRMSQITTSLATLVVPKIINMTNEVILRMQLTKKFLEKKFKCKNSYANYVLFKDNNKYTEKFGCKKIEGYYRMALIDMESLNGK